jgi:hypothetical protein
VTFPIRIQLASCGFVFSILCHSEDGGNTFSETRPTIFYSTLEDDKGDNDLDPVADLCSDSD